MTEAEREVLRLLAEAYNHFSQLPELHYRDYHEFVDAIHAAQNIVLARAGLRATGVTDRLTPNRRDFPCGCELKEVKRARGIG